MTSHSWHLKNPNELFFNFLKKNQKASKIVKNYQAKIYKKARTQKDKTSIESYFCPEVIF